MPPKHSLSSEAVGGTTISVRVLPRAKQNKIVEILGDGTIKIRLTAPPVEGKANKALIKFLADVLGLPKSKIKIISGASSRNKALSILGMDAPDLLEKINREMKL